VFGFILFEEAVEALWEWVEAKGRWCVAIAILSYVRLF
jgi:hypothetical protein